MFAPPPPEIGEVLSGDSTLHVSNRNGSGLWVRIAITVAVFGVVAAYFATNKEPIGLVLGVIAGAGVAMAALWYASRLDAKVTYVGTAGLASIRRTSIFGGADGPTTTTLLLFDRTDCLRIGTSNNAGPPGLMAMGAMGSEFEFRWSDRRDMPMFTVRAANVAKPVAHAPLNFARAAEAAWSDFRAARYEEELARDGSIGFALLSGRVVRLGDGFIELRGFQKEPVRLNRNEVDRVTLTDNTFRIVHVDSTWWGRGKFAFSYGDLGNAKLFVTFLKKLMSKDQAVAS